MTTTSAKYEMNMRSIQESLGKGSGKALEKYPENVGKAKRISLREPLCTLRLCAKRKFFDKKRSLTQTEEEGKCANDYSLREPLCISPPCAKKNLLEEKEV